MSTSEAPRPELVAELFSLAFRYGVTPAELHAAVDAIPTGKARRPKGRPKTELYGRLTFGMWALVGIYQRHPFTAAKQLLNLAKTPVGQRENHARALVRQFGFSNHDISKEDGFIRQMNQMYVMMGAAERVQTFWYLWEQTGLPWPAGVKSRGDCQKELRRMSKSAGSEAAATALQTAWFRSVDQSLAEIDLSSS